MKNTEININSKNRQKGCIYEQNSFPGILGLSWGLGRVGDLKLIACSQRAIPLKQCLLSKADLIAVGTKHILKMTTH